MKKENNKIKPWTKLSERIVYKNERFYISHEKFLTPSQKKGDYFIIHTNKNDHSVIIIPLKDDKIIFTYQYRYAIKKWALELPGGGQEQGFSTLGAAKNELEEELGYKAKSWKKIGTYTPWSGPCAEQGTIFIVKNLTKTKQRLEDTEKDLKIKEISIKNTYQMLDDGKIADCQTVAALTFARKYLFTKN